MKISLASALFVCVAAVSFAAEPIVAPGAKLEKVAGGFGLADGPAYDGKGNLYFPDVKSGHLHRYSEADGKMHMWKENFGKVSAMAMGPGGSIYASDNGRARIVKFTGDEMVVVAAEEATTPPRAPNDLVVDAHGGVYYTLSRQACVQYARDGKIVNAVPEIKGANGIGLSPDGKTLYVAAHSERTIWAYPIEAPGKVGSGKLLCRLGEGPGGGSDGMEVDAAGNLYGTGQGGVYVFSPDGKLLTKIDVEEKPLVNLTFGGKDLKTLYITAGTSVYRIELTQAGQRVGK